MRKYLLTGLMFIACFLSCGDTSLLAPLYEVNQILSEPSLAVEVEGMTDEAWATIDYFDEHWGGGHVTDPYNEKLKVERREGGWYNRSIHADGITIVGNDATLDVHFKSARLAILLMTAKRPELRDAFKDAFYVILGGGVSEVATEHGWGYPRLYFDRKIDPDIRHFHGIPELYGSHPKYSGIIVGGGLSPQVKKPRPAPVIFTGYTINTAVNSTDKALGCSMSTVGHEFVHALDWVLTFYDPTFHDKLEHAMENAKEKGLWDKVPYVSLKYPAHFFTGIVETWFYRIGPKDDVPYQNIFETVDEFVAYDPVVGELMQEWFIHVPFQELLSAEAVMARENR